MKKKKEGNVQGSIWYRIILYGFGLFFLILTIGLTAEIGLDWIALIFLIPTIYLFALSILGSDKQVKKQCEGCVDALINQVDKLFI